MVKQNPKEKLNNKSIKIIDLILDEVYDGGEKIITASFRDKKHTDKKYTLTIGLEVSYDQDTKADDTDPLPINPSTTDPDGTTTDPVNPLDPYQDDTP